MAKEKADKTQTTANRVAAAYNRKKTEIADTTEETAATRVQRARTQTVVEKASQKTQADVLKGLTHVKLTVTNALDTIANQLTTEIENLKTVQEAITLQEENLKTLHGITAEADSLQALLLAKEDERVRLDAEMAETRKRWDDEKREQVKAEQEYRNEIAKQRKWEQELYHYDTQKARKTDADAWTEQQAQKKREFEDAIAKARALVEERAKAVLEQENENVKLREQVAKFDETLKAEVERQKAIALNALKKDLGHEFAVQKLQIENSLALKVAENAALQARIAELAKQNAELDQKYKQASDKVQQIAEKAIEGASKQAVVVQTAQQDVNGDARRK